MNTEQQILARFQELRQELSAMFSKLSSVESEAQEHELVIKALEPMDPSRKACRLVGEVLVERTVAEVLPAVRKNKENLDGVLATMQQQVQAKKQELSDFQKKYKIRASEQGGEEEDEPEDRKGAPSSSQGVLVATSKTTLPAIAQPEID